MKTSGHGFVSNAENAEMAAYWTKRNPNQQIKATDKPARAVGAWSL
jgi:hypothetical protein